MFQITTKAHPILRHGAHVRAYVVDRHGALWVTTPGLQYPHRVERGEVRALDATARTMARAATSS